MLFAPILLVLVCVAALTSSFSANAKDGREGVRKIADVVIYKDPRFHCAFPSVIRRPDGELIVAFRRAPDWRPFGTKSYTHTDPNSYLVLVRSKDEGRTWTSEPELMFAHAFGGSQDPCMVQLKDQSIVCTSYGWSYVPKDVLAKLKEPFFHHGNFVFLGGYILRSKDAGHSWQGPIVPPHCDAEANLDLFGNPVAAYNRGAMCEGQDGRLYWVVAANDTIEPRKSSTHLLISADKGTTWRYSCPVAKDDKVTFNETSIHQTPKGDLVAFLRTANLDDHGCIARSTDGGKTFGQWQDMGFQGHPFHALPLPDKRVLLVYGYRHEPFGIRARILDSECTNYATAQELVLRDDGGSEDLGYPWSTVLSKRQVLVTYYFNNANATRFIAGTILQLE